MIIFTMSKNASRSCAGAMQNFFVLFTKKRLHFSSCTCHPCAGAVQLRPDRRENRHSCAGATIVSPLRLAGSSVSPLTNTLGGLSGGGRVGDTSGAAPAPSFVVVARLRARALTLDFALPSSSGKHTQSMAQAHHDARAQQYVDCAVPLGAPGALLPSHLCQEPRCFSLEENSWCGAVLSHSFLQPQCCCQGSFEGE